MRDKPSPELMRALETLGKRPVQPPATPQEPEQAQTLNDVFDVFETWARRKGATDTSSVSLGFWAFNEFHAIIGQPLRDWLLSRRASTPSPEGQTWHEEWRGVVGYEGRYEVSCFGRVRKLGGPIVGQWRKSAGYYQVRLSEPRAVHLVHRLVAKAFIPNHENKPGVNHIDFDTINNAVANLEWCTQAENIQHSAKAGRMNRPEMRGKRPTVAAFTDEQVAAMRQQYATGGETWSSLAAKFGVSKRTVGRILRREVYSYV